MDANTFKQKIDAILTEAVEVNQQQIVGGAAEDFATLQIFSWCWTNIS